MGSLVTGDTSNLVDDKTFESLMLETFTPQTYTETTDNQGGFTKAWVDGSTFEGRLSRLLASEGLSDDKETAIGSHKVYCLTTVDVDPEDRIVLGSRTFLVKGVLRPSNLTTGGHLEITVQELDYEV